MQTKNIKISLLKRAEYNPRTISKRRLEDLKKQLERDPEFLKVRPLIVNSRKGRENIVIAGNQRLAAAIELGWNEIPCIVVDLPLRREKEWNVKDNNMWGEWEWNLLKEHFDLDLMFAGGFDKDAMDRVFSVTKEENFNAKSEYDKIKKAKSVYGEVYKLGRHRLMCGDATKIKDLKKLMNGKKAKLCFTSPPYNMAAKVYADYSDNLKSDEYINFNMVVIENIKKVLKGFIFWNISYNKNARWEFIEIIHRITNETGLKFLELIVWNKKHALPITSKHMLTRQYEDILLVGDEDSIRDDIELFYLGANRMDVYFNKKNQKKISNYWEIGTNKTQLENHLACFPVALPRKGILLMTQMKDIVLDPFGGSGSTLIAAHETERVCYMMELDPKYCDVIRSRYIKMDKK